jgi:hypothetical protein
MRRRRRNVGLSLDSFLDIVTNVVGVLILLAVVTVLSAGNVELSMGTPILHDPPEGTDRAMFECRKNRVLRVDEDEIHDAVTRLLDAQPGGKFRSLDDLQRQLREHDVGNRLFRLEVSGGARGLVSTIKPRRATQGETIQQLKAASSGFRRALAKLSPRTHYLYFVVREDSFKVFREARRIAHAAGFSTGWDPLKRKEAITFSPHGKSGVAVQ